MTETETPSMQTFTVRIDSATLFTPDDLVDAVLKIPREGKRAVSVMQDSGLRGQSGKVHIDDAQLRRNLRERAALTAISDVAAKHGLSTCVHGFTGYIGVRTRLRRHPTRLIEWWEPGASAANFSGWIIESSEQNKTDAGAIAQAIVEATGEDVQVRLK